MRPFPSWLVFILLLVVLRRVAGVPVSIVGSILLTIAVTLIVRAISSRRDPSKTDAP